MQWQLYLVRKIAAVFGCSAQDLGLTGDLNRATAEVQQEISEDRGLRPLMLLVEEYLNREIVGSFVRYAGKKKLYNGEWDMATYRKSVALSMLNPRDPRAMRIFQVFSEANLGNLHFNYKVATGRSRREIREDIKTYLNELPIWTINEARAELNLDPIPGGDQILIPTNLGPVPLDAFVGGKPTILGPDGTPQPMNQEQEKYLLGLDGKPIFLSTNEAQALGREVLQAPEGSTKAKGPRSPTLSRLETDLAIRVGRWFRQYSTVAPIHDWAALAVSLAPDLKGARTKQNDAALARLLAEIAAFDHTAAGRELQGLFNTLLSQHGIAAYNVGGQIALERIGVAASFNLLDAAVIEGLEELARGTVAGISQTTHSALADILAQGAMQGAGPDAIARDITTTLRSEWPELTSGRARTIANTEVNRAMSKATRDTYSRNGIEKQEWITSGDGRVCPVCEANEAQGAVTESFGSGDDYPPAHPDCLTGDTAVSAVGISATSERWYDGDIIIIHTASGKKLSVTPNHPVLTPQGWMAAGALNVGGHVISSRIGKWMSPLLNLDNENVPTRIKEIAEAFRRSEHMTTVPVPTSAEDFHGDGVGSEVAIIRANGLLRDGFDSACRKHMREKDFVGSTAAPCLDGRGAQTSTLDGIPLPATGIVGRRDLSSPLGAGHGAPFESLGFALTSPQDTALVQSPIDARAGYAILARKLIDGLAGEIFEDELIKINIVTFSGHVYNLQTESGAYIANGIIAHNCRCALIPVIPDGWGGRVDCR